MEYKITFKNHFRALRGVLIYHIIYAIFYIYALYYLDDGHGIFTMVFGIGYAVSMVPTVFLYVEYYFRNKNDIVYIDMEKKHIIINDDPIIPFSEIEKITLYMAHAWHRKSEVRIFPFEDYRYSKIQMKTGNKYIFTCLMAFNLEKVMATVSGVPIEKRVRQFASPLIN